MIRISKNEDCCGCHACQTACPQVCIEMVTDSEGFLYPQVNKLLCTDCGICEKVCPMLLTPRSGESPAAFAAWHRDAAVRAESSSGGVFSALMRQTLQEGGVVIGAAFDNNMTLCHQSAQTEAESHKFRGSKYLQSIIGNSYHEAEIYLQQGRSVLFSGTPCQIAGLYSYLERDDDDLTTCDIVCHGVPSPKVFAAYRHSLERQYGAKAERISFRRKDHGWKRFSVALSFDNATEYRRIITDDPFMLGFLRDTYLRPSCHVCLFSRIPRVADISLADFWGVGNHHPEWDDDKGTSLILIQSKKGQKVLEACSGEIIVHMADLNEAIRSNPCISGSVPPSKLRTNFFYDFDRLSFDKVMNKYMSPPTFRIKVAKSTIRAIKYGLRCFKLFSESVETLLKR